MKVENLAETSVRVWMRDSNPKNFLFYEEYILQFFEVFVSCNYFGFFQQCGGVDY